MLKIRVVLLALGLLFALACGGHPGPSSMSTSAAPKAATPASGPAPSAGPNASAAPGADPWAWLFPSAAWYHSAPSGSALNISGMASRLHFFVNTHDGGFDEPVAFADGSLGCTTFTDTQYFNFHDSYCVPNPAGGYHPSVGGWGANDGHLIVVDSAHGVYYDFWKLLADANGRPTSTNVGQISQGSLSGDGTPGATAAVITALAGDIMPGELACETCLDHALSVIVPGSMNSNQVGHQAPAVKTDGTVGGAIFREGAKIRFDPAVNVETLPVSMPVKAILHALQNYGGVIVDQTGGNGISFYSALANQPDLTGIDQIGQHLFIYY